MRKLKNIEILKPIHLYPEKRKTGVHKLRDKKGCYIIYLNAKNNILYVGKATTDLEDVITRHFQAGNYSQVKFTLYHDDPKVRYFAQVYLTTSKQETVNLERYLIEKYLPKLNIRIPEGTKSITRWKAKQKYKITTEIEKKIEKATGRKNEFIDVPF
jgi:excinuclease UvrABC nuclease subunit